MDTAFFGSVTGVLVLIEAIRIIRMGFINFLDTNRFFIGNRLISAPVQPILIRIKIIHVTASNFLRITIKWNVIYTLSADPAYLRTT
ncbi:MAG: hypothetical protein ACI9FD_001782 [Gammaproteobacteria bacterium]|jgi:hypothetical protein